MDLVVRTLLLALVCIGWLPLPHQLHAQVTFQAVPVTLGETREAVMERLDGFDLTNRDRDFWEISVGELGTTYRYLGGIEFEDGVLVFVTRNWGPGMRASATATLQAVMRAVSSALQGRAALCAVMVTHRREPGVDIESLELECGDASVSISTFSIQGRAGVGVTESWRLGRGGAPGG